MLYRLLSVLSSVVLASCLLEEQNNGTALMGNNGRNKRQIQSKVNLDVYYESLCPDSITFYIKELIPVIKRFGPYINLRVYPYGKASTQIQDGITTFDCQHGEKECYGNKLQACTIEQLPFWLDFNACLLSQHSDDNAVDACARMYNINGQPIKMCAKGARGTELLAFYGEESAKVSYSFIPHIRINSIPLENRASLMAAVYNVIMNSQNS